MTGLGGAAVEAIAGGTVAIDASGCCDEIMLLDVVATPCVPRPALPLETAGESCRRCRLFRTFGAILSTWWCRMDQSQKALEELLSLLLAGGFVKSWLSIVSQADFDHANVASAHGGTDGSRKTCSRKALT